MSGAGLDVLSPELSGSGAATGAWAAEHLCAAGLRAEALYVATSDGGAREALAFWASAAETGLAFASPAAFPFTLATSATGQISRALDLHGPCTTYVGPEAFSEAEDDARADLAEGVVASVLVVALDGRGPIGPCGGPVRVRLRAHLLSLSPASA